MTMPGHGTPTILVPVDGSTASEHAAAYAARTFGGVGRLVLLQVIGSAEQEAFDEATATLSKLADTLEVATRPELRVVEGNPADEILRLSAADDIQLIVMATRGRGAAGRAIFGSVADRVSRNAVRPTLLIRGDIAPPPTARIVVPLDGSALAERAVPVAAGLARDLGLGVLLVRVLDVLEVFAVLRAGRVDRTVDDAYEQARLLLQSDVEQYLDAVRTRTPELPRETTTRVLTGTPAHVLLDLFAEDDLVVMTSRGHGGAQRWLLGSTAEKLVRESSAPVLLVPDVPVQPFV